MLLFCVIFLFYIYIYIYIFFFLSRTHPQCEQAGHSHYLHGPGHFLHIGKETFVGELVKFEQREEAKPFQVGHLSPGAAHSQ